MYSQQDVKIHLLIIITIVVSFTTFMMGYSFSPFMEVGFGSGQGEHAVKDSGVDAELLKQYEDLYKTGEE